jgi:4-alpha-glucanotransferase
MHLSSLPSSGGIGKMGKSARDFVDFLNIAGQSYWQILPICPTSYGDSPYQSFSTFAGNPYFIDFEELEKKGLLKRAEYSRIKWGSAPERVDYGILYKACYKVLQKAVDRFLIKPQEEFENFCRENDFWLDDYALFMTLKDLHDGLSWLDWEEPLRNHETEALKKVKSKYGADINFWKALQYFFFEQWVGLRSYANENGIDIIGDLPFYVALDSADVWANPELFS